MIRPDRCPNKSRRVSNGTPAARSPRPNVCFRTCTRTCGNPAWVPSSCAAIIHDIGMKKQCRYRGHHFPHEIISHPVWLYHRVCLSFRDIEDLLAERGIIVSYESIRQWCLKFCPRYAKRLRKRQGKLRDTWYMDGITIITVQAERRYLWCAVGQDDNVIDILIQPRKDKQAAKRFSRKMSKEQANHPGG